MTQRLRRVIAILALGCGPQSCAFLCNTESLAGAPDGGSGDGGSSSCDAGALAPVHPAIPCVIDGSINQYDVQLSWPIGGPGVLGYQILRRQTCASDPAFYPVGFVDGGTTTVATDLVQCWRFQYSYRIVPVSACGSPAETTDDPYYPPCNGGDAGVDAEVVQVFTLRFCDGGFTPNDDGGLASCCLGPDSGC